MAAEEDSGSWVRSALNEYQVPLTRYAFRILGDADAARDVVQDTFLKLCKQDPSKIENHLAEWLYTVCRNQALDVRRKESRMRALTEVDRQTLRSDGRDPASLAELRDTSRVVLLALEQLPEKQQEVVRLKYQNELSYREISQVTGLSVSNVGFILHTALKSIREKLKEESPGGSAQIRRIK